MLLSKSVIQRWNSKNKKRYIELGYRFTKMRDEFECDVKHLPSGSHVLVKIECDYCGKEYTKEWCRYISENQESYIHKDCCIDCKKYKNEEAILQKYGVNTVLKLDTVKEKIASTNIGKYGTPNPFQSEYVKNKIRETNIERYGYPNPLKNKEICERMSKTCIERYGVKYYVMTQVYRGSDSPVWKGGVARIRNERASYDYIQWRKAVFDRDNYTCQICGDKSGMGHAVTLNAHHLHNWKDYVDLRYCVDNGITLCEFCHNTFHIIYGRRNNNIKQFKDYKDMVKRYAELAGSEPSELSDKKPIR